MSVESAKKRALRMLEKRDFAVGELTDRLRRKGETPEDAGAAVSRLAEVGFLDDVRYAGMVVRHYAARGFGRARIREELRRRFVPRELWDEALAEAPDPDDTLDTLLRIKLKSDAPDAAELKRASDALCRRGYSWDEVRAAVERYRAERNSFE